MSIWRNSTLSIFYGLACTKAGVSPLQGESGGFDSLRVHKVTFTGYKRDAGSIPVLRETVVSLSGKTITYLGCVV